MKKCNTCFQELPLTEFNKRKALSDGLDSFCRTCSKAKSKKQYQKTGKFRHLINTFKITAEQYTQMLKHQQGVCAICHKSEIGKSLAVDHCHRTGNVRGLLCMNCNLTLGHAQDSPDRLRQAALYLERFFNETYV